MLARSKEPAKRPELLDIPSAVNTDIKVKLLREKGMRKSQVKPSQPPQQQQLLKPQRSASTPDLSKITGKKKSRAKAFLKHIEQNRDRIKFNKGELQFDGIKTGGSDMDDLTTVLIDDKNPGKVA